jgi:hypothetical protein
LVETRRFSVVVVDGLDLTTAGFTKWPVMASRWIVIVFLDFAIVNLLFDCNSRERVPLASHDFRDTPLVEPKLGGDLVLIPSVDMQSVNFQRVVEGWTG